MGNPDTREDMDIAEELVHSKIVHIQLLDIKEVNKIKKILGLDKEFTFDTIILLDEVE
jgi:hypothetical protein